MLCNIVVRAPLTILYHDVIDSLDEKHQLTSNY